jgi:PKD repeat protein
VVAKDSKGANTEGSVWKFTTQTASGSAPVADFTASKTSIAKGETIQFTDKSTNSPTSWLWTFGDGTTSTQQSPSKTYNTAGNYTVSLKATNGSGNNTKTMSITVTEPTNLPPVADFTVSKTSITKGETIQFTDKSTNSPTSWLWTFGDGTTSTQQNPSKTYNSVGNYTVTLKTANSFGDNSKTMSIAVTESGTPISSPIDMVFVQGSTFQMGSNTSWDSERPAHSVTLSNYYIGKTEVTQKQWREVMGNNPSYLRGDDLPVEHVRWDDVQTFITKLNQQTGKNYRLPTEAEWEFAALGGNNSKGYTYAGSNSLGDVAWYKGNMANKTHQVGTKAANELGLFDMSGNVYEWCADWYGTYSSAAQTNPTGPVSGSRRVHRGGYWDSDANNCRVTNRGNSAPGDLWYMGFRLAHSSN